MAEVNSTSDIYKICKNVNKLKTFILIKFPVLNMPNHNKTRLRYGETLFEKAIAMRGTICPQDLQTSQNQTEKGLFYMGVGGAGSASALQGGGLADGVRSGEIRTLQQEIFLFVVSHFSE